VIGKLSGKLLENCPPTVLIDVHGVGYEVEVTLGVMESQPMAGQAIALHTHFVVREDAQLLYGFQTRQERDLFRLLLKVNGVGPKLGMSILSHMTIAEFVQCVREDRVTRLTKMPGVGKKTAERLVIEMRDRLKTWHGLNDDASGPEEGTKYDLSSIKNDAEAALVALGYKPAEATKIVDKVNCDGKSRDEIIRLALKSMLNG